MPLFGHPLHELTAKHVEIFLDNAEVEPLLWEAKGTALDKHEIRRQICGFANGLQTAYLILGAEETDGKWVIGGLDFPDDPPAWVSSVIGDGLRPLPLIDVHSIRLNDSRQIAIVEIPPIAIAPCICRGTVFERVSGRTIAVKDPGRLADLYKRGHAARENAIAAAGDAATAVLGNHDSPGYGNPWPRFALALGATGHPPDISSRLFSEGFEEQMIAIVERKLVPPLPNASPFHSSKLTTGFGQSSRFLNCEDRIGHGKPCYWYVRVGWDGTVVICGAWEIDSIPARSFFEELVKAAWQTADELLGELGGYGPRHMELRIDPSEALIGATQGNPNPTIAIGYGPAQPLLGPDGFGRVERELRRATGERIYEPSDGHRS